MVVRESLVPYHRIQQVDVVHDPLERLLGLSTLTPHRRRDTDAKVPGIPAESAESLRRALWTRRCRRRRLNCPHRRAGIAAPFNVLLGLAGIVSARLLGLVLEGVGVELLLSVLGLREIVSWWFRTYEVRPDELLISEGVLTRHSRVVPYRRVQQVDLHQGLLAQLLGLVALHIETAGSAAGRVKLSLLDRPTGERLRGFVLARRVELQASEGTGAAELAVGGAGTRRDDRLRGGRQLLALDGGQLLLAGVTSDLVVAVLA